MRMGARFWQSSDDVGKGGEPCSSGQMPNCLSGHRIHVSETMSGARPGPEPSEACIQGLGRSGEPASGRFELSLRCDGGALHIHNLGSAG